MILMMLYPSLDYNNKFHIDHIYPKSKFTKGTLARKGVPFEKLDEYIAHVNDISNLQMLAAIPNIEKQADDFDKWFNETCPTNTDKMQYRTINYLPDMNYTFDVFLDFIEERKILMKKQLERELM